MTKSSILALALVALPAVAGAQGAISLQGFGYPPGQLGTRALGTGGGLGEFDPFSALNPASIEGLARSALYVQYEPEFRSVDANGRSSSTTTARFPIVAGVLRANERLALGLGASTLLDRSWQTTFDSTRTIDGEEVTVRERYRSLGSISDVRLSAAYRVANGVRVGAGLHGFTGVHRLRATGEFGDSTELTLLDDAISYGGIGFSAGVEWHPSSVLSVAGSARKGGTIKARRDDDVIASGKVPDRFGAAVRYDGIRGTVLAARTEWTGWSQLGELGSESLTAFDTWEVGGGAEVEGPRFASRIVLLRGGLRWRTLPFGLGDAEVKEIATTFGAGVPLARDRASFDLALEHARRSAGGDAKERAWIVSVGLSVRQ